MNIIKNKSIIILIFLLLMIGVFSSCGLVEDPPMSISGDITLSSAIEPDFISSSVYLIISRTMDTGRIEESPEEQIIAYVLAEQNDTWSYDVDLTETDAKSEDTVYLFAFIEKDTSLKELPLPSPGDYVGMYCHSNTSPGHQLVEGENENINIEINRIHSGLKASIHGSVEGAETGPLLLVAFSDAAIGRGEIDVKNLNVDNVVAFAQLQKHSSNIEYSLSVLPYIPVGSPLPVTNISVFALIDTIENSKLDDGERIGFYREGSEYPGMLTVEYDDLHNIDISLDRTYYENNTTISGNIEFDTIEWEGTEPVTATVIAYHGDDQELYPASLDHQNIIGYTVIDIVEESNPYTMEMLPFYAFPLDGPLDGVSFFVLLDEDGNNAPDPGEMFGFYIDNDNMTTMCTLPAEGLSDIDIKLDKTYHDHDAVVEGNLLGDVAGDFIIIAYAGGDPENVTEDNFDAEKVVAIAMMNKNTTDPEPYSVKILPQFEVPVEDVSLFALHDANGNNSLDEGEQIGFYKEESGKPGILTIDNGILSNIDIVLDRTYYPNETTISGTIEGTGPAIATIIAYQGDDQGLYSGTLDHQNILGYTVIDINAGSNPYIMEMLPFSAFPLNGVSFFVLLDENGNNAPDPGEMFGFYIDNDNMTTMLTLPPEGLTGIDITPDKIYHEHDMVIEGNILGDETGEFIILAYGGSDPENVAIEDFDPDSVVAMAVINKYSADSVPYSMKILPQFDVPLADVSFFALHDANGNGKLDEGEKIGFHTKENGKPGIFTVDNGILSGIDITVDRTYYYNETTIAGTINGSTIGMATIIAYQGDEEELYSGTLVHENILGYAVIDKVFESVPYTIAMLPFFQFPRDNVSIFVLMDENDNGLPDEGEPVGFYMDNENLTTKVTVPAEGLAGMDVLLEKIYHEHDAVVTGTIQGDVTGDVIVLAYLGDLENIGAAGFDINNVTAYAEITMDAASPLSYSVKILPQFGVPLEGVSLFAVHDANGNGTLDDGERIGFYKEESGKPGILTVDEGILPGIDITFDRTYYNNNATIAGTIDGSVAGTATVIAYQGDEEELYPGTLVLDNVLGYTVIEKGSGSVPYTIAMLPFFQFPRDNVSIFVLMDENNNGLPDEGEPVGFYMDNENLTTKVTVPAEGLTGMDILLEVEDIYHEHEAVVTGTIHGEVTGDITVLAYNGDLANTGVADFDINNVAAYAEISKDTAGSVPYSVKILPHFGVPLAGVSLFAVQDANRNGTLDDGEKIGFYTIGNGKPEILTIYNGILPNIDISLDKTYYKNNTEITGTIQGTGPGKATIIAYAGSEGELFPDTLDYDKVLGYTVIDIQAGPNPYTIKMLPFNIFPHEYVSIFVLMDENENELPDQGETIGFYFDTSTMTTQVALPSEGLSGVDITLDKIYYTHDASIQGEIQGDVTGDITIIAYAGDLQEMDGGSFDINDVAAFTVITKNDVVPVPYSMKLLPYFDIPLSGITVAAIRDTNNNRMADEGELIGYYRAGGSEPVTLIIDYGITSNVDIDLNKTLLPNNAFIQGTIQGPENGTATIVAYQGNEDELYPTTLDHENIIGYSFVDKSAAWVPYSIDIFPFYQFPLDNVSIYVLMDQNSNQLPDQGEAIGFYMDNENLTSMVTVPEYGLAGIDIMVDKIYNEHDVSIAGFIHGDVTGEITVLAYHGNLHDVGVNNFEVDKVVSLAVIPKPTTDTVAFSMRVLPQIGLPLDDGVILFAICDLNGNREPDEGEPLGFFFDTATMVETVPVPLTGVSGIDITLDKIYHDHDVAVTGSILGDVTGEITVIAYQGNLDESGISGNFNIDNVMAYTTVMKTGAAPEPYRAQIFNLFELPRDGVSLFAIRDSNGNRQPDEGEIIGYYRNTANPSAEITIPAAGDVSGIDIALDSTYYDHDTSISGLIQGNETGEVTLIAYAGELENTSFDDFDMDYVVAYAKISKDSADPVPYSIRIFPLFDVPIANVSLFALMDENGNNMPDDGERLGFYSDVASKTISFYVPVEGATGIDVTIDRKYLENDITVAGRITRSSNAGSVSGNLLIIAYSGDLVTLDTNNFDYQNIILLKDCGPVSYPYNFSETILPFDYDYSSIPLEVNVFAIIDVNRNGIPDVGDRVGIHFVDENLNTKLVLSSGTNTGVNIEINKKMIDDDITVRFKLNRSVVLFSPDLPAGKDALLLIIQEDGVFTGSIFNIFSKFLPVELDRYTIGLKQTVINGNSNYEYELPIAPIIDDQIPWPPSPTLQTLVYTFADTNENGRFDSDDWFFYYGKCGAIFCSQYEYTLTSDSVQSLENDQGWEGLRMHMTGF